jgi:hypothetical protein
MVIQLHKKGLKYKQDYKDLHRELNQQIRMNKYFIDSMPKMDGEVFKEMATKPVTGEFAVLGSGFIPERKDFKTISGKYLIGMI